MGTLDAAALAERTRWLGHGLGGMRGGRFVWESRPALNPFRDVNLDELTARGVVWSQGYPRTRTRRVLTLLNAVCAALERDQVAPVLGFHAYAQYMAPPITAPGRVDPLLVGESCHSFLMPYMKGVRDTLEYQPGATNPYEAPGALPPATVGALGRMLAAPDQFNHERWSRSARQTGYYEYITSAGYVGPHLYSARLHAAVRRGLRHHGLRGFISETTPNWCFDAPMLWELPRMLWDPGPLVGAEVGAHLPALRGDFCAAAFGPAAAPMQAFFDLCEEAWAATRDEWKVYETDGSAGRTYPDRRLRSGASSGLCGDGYGGRGAKITTLDGFFGAPRGGGARNRLLGCWQRLNAAYDTPSLDELSRSRVQMFRRGFGLTLLIGLWYEPVQRAFEVIRRHRYDLARMRKMAVVVDAVMYAHQEIRETVSNVGLPSTRPLPEGPTAPGSAATVTVLVNYSDRHPLTDGPHIPPRTPPAALSAADRALRDAAADRINPADSPINGLRSLRNQVHRYLALSLDSAATDRFPTFMARAEEVRGLSDVGLGLFASQASALADDAPFPRAGADIEGPHRLIGLEAFYLMQYIDWWNRIPRTGATSAAREAELSERIRLLTRSNIHPTPDPGFGWCFTGLREIAGCVAVHGFAEMVFEEMETRSGLLDNIARG